MDAIVLFSHGSLLCGAGEALKEHAVRLQQRGLAPLVAVGYLNYSDPSFADAVAQVVAQGADRILIAPYFLVPGKFVREDLPQAVAAARSAYPSVTFVVAEAIGFDTLLAEALLQSAQTALGPERWRDDILRATVSCRPDVHCPLYDTPHCPKAGTIPQAVGK